MYGTHFKPPQCKVLSTTQLTIENIHIDKYLHPQQTCQATLPTEWASRITMTNDSWNYYYYYYYSTTHDHIAHPSLEKIQFHLQIHFGLLGMAILLIIVTGFFMCSTVFFFFDTHIRSAIIWDNNVPIEPEQSCGLQWKSQQKSDDNSMTSYPSQ